MTISDYLANLRAAVGSRLLMVSSVAIRVWDAEGRLLMVRDRDGGQWSLPAGAIDPGETPEAAASRELLEETGMRSRSLQLVAGLGGEAFRHTYPNGDAVEYQIFVFAVDATGPVSPRDRSEVAEARFFRETDAPPLALPYPASLLWREG